MIFFRECQSLHSSAFKSYISFFWLPCEPVSFLNQWLILPVTLTQTKLFSLSGSVSEERCGSADTTTAARTKCLHVSLSVDNFIYALGWHACGCCHNNKEHIYGWTWSKSSLACLTGATMPQIGNEFWSMDILWQCILTHEYGSKCCRALWLVSLLQDASSFWLCFWS